MSTKRLYTIVLEFQGGTYVGQANGDTPNDALFSWTPPSGEIAPDLTFSQLLRQLYDQIVSGDRLTIVLGNINVWCISGTYAGSLILVHIILTANEGKPQIQ